MTIGIALTLYNGEQFIERQLESIRIQTVKPDRVVMCDDGSKDNTVEIVKDYIKKYNLEDSWQLIINEKNLGYVGNFYKGIGLLDTDLVFLSDQDDLWLSDKLEKMSQVMNENSKINLLSCKHGIVDFDDNRMHSILEKEGKSTLSLTSISTDDIMRAYRWPGMAMCIRKSFFESIYPYIKELRLAHDMIFAVCASDINSFYEYDYIGVLHRRHSNNLANEESRIFKLLNLERKLRDIRVTNELLEGIVKAELPISEKTKEAIEYRLKLSLKREEAIKNRDRKALKALYKSDDRGVLRFVSKVCDIWLINFGSYAKRGR